jgi:DNA helicase-2/ATP-dependent DNA helicase PcrA
VLVDEYQDTNQAQYVIARVLCRDHQNICATGDPDQSIYGWRGADISNILDFEQDFPEAKIIRLEQNYRSSKMILSAADGLIRANRQRREKKLWTENPAGEPVEVVCCPDDRSEAQHVAGRIGEYVAQGGRYDEVAVFYRVNSLSRLLEQALRSAGIAYQMVRGVAFYSRKEIKDVLAYLRVLVNPRDSVSLLRIINVPARGIGSKTVKLLEDYSRTEGISVLEALGQGERIGGLSRSVGRVKEFAGLLKELSAGPQKPVRAVLENVVRRSGLEKEYANECSSDSSAIDNVNELISSAAQYDLDNPEGDLEDYLQQTALISDVDSFDAQGGAVALMTMHTAKGLEFPVVFMIGLEEGLLPHSRSVDSPPELEEERRLCFVGMTRAKRRLLLSYARYRQFRGASSRTVPSPFLGELPAESLRLSSLEDTRAQGSSAKELPGESRPKDSLKRSAVSGARRRAGRAGFVGNLVEGSMVYHPRLGLGKIEEIGRDGKFTRAVINFEQAGSKTMMLEYADLREAND